LRQPRNATLCGLWLTSLAILTLEIVLTRIFSVYLGSPTYALAVVLFTLLLSSGIGSLTTHGVSPGDAPRRLRWAIPSLIAVMGLYLLLLPAIVRATQQWMLAGRIGMAIVVVLPAGFLMGQPFPLGIKEVRRQAPGMIPWLWAVNGAASVVGSVLATIVALRAGFPVVSLTGMLCYGLALALVVWPDVTSSGHSSRRAAAR
jgi:hypothetical protein